MKMPTFFNERISFGLQRRFGNGPEYPENEQSGEKQYGTYLWYANGPLISNGRWHYHIKNINVMPCEDYNAGHDHKPVDPFKIAVHQYKEREHEIHGHHSKKWQLIILDPGNKISYLLGNVGVPYQHELGKPQIGPKNADPKHKFGQIVDMAIVYLL